MLAGCSKRSTAVSRDNAGLAAVPAAGREKRSIELAIRDPVGVPGAKLDGPEGFADMAAVPVGIRRVSWSDLRGLQGNERSLGGKTDGSPSLPAAG